MCLYLLVSYGHERAILYVIFPCKYTNGCIFRVQTEGDHCVAVCLCIAYNLGDRPDDVVCVAILMICKELSEVGRSVVPCDPCFCPIGTRFVGVKQEVRSIDLVSDGVLLLVRDRSASDSGWQSRNVEHGDQIKVVLGRIDVLEHVTVEGAPIIGGRIARIHVRIDERIKLDRSSERSPDQGDHANGSQEKRCGLHI
jgi:hypothetical protein